MDDKKNLLDLSAFPSNANKDREKAKEPEEHKKVEIPIVIDPSKVSVKKESAFTKFRNSMIAEDAGSMGSYIMNEIFVPTLKDLIYNIVTGALESCMWGTAKGRRRNSSYRGNGIPVDYTQYQYSKNGAVVTGTQQPDRSLENTRTRTINARSLEFNSYQAAQEALDDARFIIGEYGKVSVNDVFDFCGQSRCVPPTMSNYGWVDLSGVRPESIRGGKYRINFPDPILINK